MSKRYDRCCSVDGDHMRGEPGSGGRYTTLCCENRTTARLTPAVLIGIGVALLIGAMVWAYVI